MKDDMAFKQAVIEAVCTMLKNCFNASEEMLECVKITVGEMEPPSAQPDIPDMNVIIDTIKNAINASTGNEAYMVGLRNGMRWCWAAWTDKEPEYEDMPPAQPGWIPVTERLPENEQDVFVTVEVRLSGRKPFRRVVRAFYTDGKHTDANSVYSWDEFPDPQYDDDDNMIIPEGWWESSDYLEQQGMIDDFVIAWREPLKPWEGDANDT